MSSGIVDQIAAEVRAEKEGLCVATAAQLRESAAKLQSVLKTVLDQAFGQPLCTLLSDAAAGFEEYARRLGDSSGSQLEASDFIVRALAAIGVMLTRHGDIACGSYTGDPVRKVYTSSGKAWEALAML